MSFDNIHMKYPVKGARVLRHTLPTVQQLRQMSWEDILAQNPQLTGNTKFDDFSIMAAFFKEDMVAINAARLLGYKGSDERVLHRSMVFRLERINSEDFLILFRLFILAGKFDRKHLFWVLTRPIVLQRGVIGAHTTRILKSICESAARKSDGNEERACKRLGISMKVFHFWITGAKNKKLRKELRSDIKLLYFSVRG